MVPVDSPARDLCLMKSSIRFALPLLIFLGLVVLLFEGLGKDPRRVPSPFIGKPAPSFRLPLLDNPERSLDNRDFIGKISLLNVWATWCVSCRTEHELLLQIAKQDGVTLFGLNYKDQRYAALNWLQQLGNPYAANAFDADGRAAIDWGVYGTPETFVIDAKGMVRHKFIGPITPDDLKNVLLPMMTQLKAEIGS
ncbi:thiol:disulfide oxidoreductase CcmG [Gammaproteobacteria bacterium]